MTDADVAQPDEEGAAEAAESADVETASGDAPEPDAEPDDTDGPADDDATGEDDEDDAAGDDTPPDEAEPAAPAPDSAAQLERVTSALFRASKNYGKRVADIFGSDWMGVTACPLCAQDFPGLITPAPRSEETIAAVRPMIGLPDLSTYAEDRFARQCERCGGLGKTLTGSRVPAYATMVCPQCKGSGFQTAETGMPVQAASNGYEAPPPPTHVDDAPLPAMSEASLEALEKMVAEGRAALAGLR